jgi:hypothetical protein
VAQCALGFADVLVVPAAAAFELAPGAVRPKRPRRLPSARGVGANIVASS